MLANVGGHISSDTVWNETSEPYVLVEDLTIDAGATLTLGPGVTLRSNFHGLDINVDGTVVAQGANLELLHYQNANAKSNLLVRDGGHLDWSGGALVGPGWLVAGEGGRIDIDGAQSLHHDGGGDSSRTGSPLLYYLVGSQGETNGLAGTGNIRVSSDLVQLSEVGAELVRLDVPLALDDSDATTLVLNASASVTNSDIGHVLILDGFPELSGNTFSGSFPIRVHDPDSLNVDGFVGNTFTATDPAVHIRGVADGAVSLPVIDGAVKRYLMTEDIEVSATASVTMAAGTSLRSDRHFYDINVFGQWSSVDATLELLDYRDESAKSNLLVHSGGNLNMNGGAVFGAGWVIASEGSEMHFSGTSFSSNLSNQPGQLLYLSGSEGSVSEIDGTFELTAANADLNADFQILTGTEVEIRNSVVELGGNSIVVDGGKLAVNDTVLRSGRLEVLDNPSSLVELSNDITFDGITLRDQGRGRFRVPNGASTRFLGDYSGQLPEGLELEIDAGGQFTIDVGEFVNNGHLYVDGTTANPASIAIVGDAKLSGAGSVTLAHAIGAQIKSVADSQLTNGIDHQIFGSGKIITERLVNQGVIKSAFPGGMLTIDGDLTNSGVISTVNSSTVLVNGNVTNSGELRALGYGTLGRETIDINGDLNLVEEGSVFQHISASARVAGNLLGSSVASGRNSAQGYFKIDKASDAASPVMLEVMSKDLGAVHEAFDKNFAFGDFRPANNSYVKLVDVEDNNGANGAEALYADMLVVEAGSTLDLNGLNVYARTHRIDGTVVGGTIHAIPDSGAIAFNSGTTGTISTEGEVDLWSFYARTGRIYRAGLNASFLEGGYSPLWPRLEHGLVEIVDSEGVVVAPAGTDFSPAQDGTFFVRVKAAAGHQLATGNYMVVLWDTSTEVRQLQLGQKVNGHLSSPFSRDEWTFAASAGQQVRFLLDQPLGLYVGFDLVGPDGWQGFSDQASDSGLINLPASGQYKIIAHMPNWQQNRDYSFTLEGSSVVELTPGTPFAGELVANHQAQVFRFTPDKNSPVVISFDDQSSENQNQVFVRKGQPPTRSSFDFAANGKGSDQRIVMPMATPEPWYILVYAHYNESPSEYSILAELEGLVVESSVPAEHGIGGDVTLTIVGAGFRPDTQVSLVSNDGAEYPASEFRFDSFTRIAATFTAGQVPIGDYAVRVYREANSYVQLPGAFTLTPGSEAAIDTRLVLPQSFGYHQLATIYIEYENTGELAMPSPLLHLKAEQNGREAAIMTLEHSRLSKGFWTTALPDGFHESITFLAHGETPGVLQPGESGRVPVYWAGWQKPWDFTYPDFEFEVIVTTADNLQEIDWSKEEPNFRPDLVGDEDWTVIYQNFQDQVGGTWGDYVKMLNENAEYLARFGTEIRNVEQLLAFEFIQADGFGPMWYQASGTDISLPLPGFDLEFRRVFPQNVNQRFDIGPLGRGWAHNWEIGLIEQGDGTVEVFGMTDHRRLFQPDVRGGYLSTSGDTWTLTRQSGDKFVLTDNADLEYHFFADGRFHFVQDLDSNSLTAEYDGVLLSRIVHSGGEYISFEYDEKERLVRVGDALDRQVNFTFDTVAGYLVGVDFHDGSSSSYTYEDDPSSRSLHAIKKLVRRDGVAEAYNFDEQGRIASWAKSKGNEAIEFIYSSTGSVMVQTEDGIQYETYYDHRRNVLRQEFPTDFALNYTYDSFGRVTQIADDFGNFSDYGYDVAGNVVSVGSQSGNTTWFTFDSLSQIISVANESGELKTFSRDGNGDVTSVNFPDGTREQYFYDEVGNVIKFVSRGRQEFRFSYDDVGRLLEREHDDGSTDSYSYDRSGNLIFAGNESVEIEFEYDEHEKLIRIGYPDEKFQAFGYDEFGRRVSKVDEAGNGVTYSYDQTGKLEKLSDEKGETLIEYEYDGGGNLIGETRQNGLATGYEYDESSRLIAITNELDSERISEFRYSYDSFGRIEQRIDISGAYQYSYSNEHQLVGVRFTANESSSKEDFELKYSYDSRGNRTETWKDGKRIAYIADGIKYSEIDGDTLKYDANGNLISVVSSEGIGRQLYSYDSLNRLTGVTTDNESWEYNYDALGNRFQVKRGTHVQSHVYDPTGLAALSAVYDTDGNQVSSYIYGLGLASQKIDGQQQFFTFDILGSTQELVATDGRVLNVYEYEPFGALNQFEPSDQSTFTFLGRHGVITDSPYRFHIRARSYDAHQGRFLTQDPIGLLGNDANLYRYAYNNPISMMDINGLGSLTFQGFAGLGLGLSGSINIGLGSDFGKLSVTTGIGGGITGEAFGAGVSVGYTSASPGDGMGVAMSGGYFGFLDTSVGVNDGQPSFNGGGSFGVGGGFFMGPTFERCLFGCGGGEGTGDGGAGGGGGDGELGAGAGSKAPTDPGSGGSAGVGIGDAAPWEPLPACEASCPGEGDGGTGSGSGSGPGGGGGGASPGGGSSGGSGGSSGAGGTSGGSGSKDPNQKIVSVGSGPENYFSDGTLLSYRVDFENDPTATAPVQFVDVKDQLPVSLDWDTFELSEVGFSDRLIAIPEGSQYFETTVPFQLEGQNLNVEISVGIDLSTGLVRALFSTVDAVTGLPPAVSRGFLPPEDGTGRGQGFFSYLVRPKAGLASETEIRNIALIQFDFGQIIATNQIEPFDPSKGTDPNLEALVTIDSDSPSGSVLPLNGRSDREFVVQWGGSDVGSGIDSFDVFVSENGGPFESWIADTKETTATFEGVRGAEYSFYALATDRVGNTEAHAAEHEAFTRVALYPKWNENNPFDSSDDGFVSPIDALVIINELNQTGGYSMDEELVGAPYFDVSQDNFLSPIDALMVINELNRTSGEGEMPEIRPDRRSSLTSPNQFGIPFEDRFWIIPSPHSQESYEYQSGDLGPVNRSPSLERSVVLEETPVFDERLREKAIDDFLEAYQFNEQLGPDDLIKLLELDLSAMEPNGFGKDA